MKKLPDLPRKNKRLEAKYDDLVANKILKRHPHPNWLLEVKMKGGSHKHHQKVAGHQVVNGKFLWKPPDNGSKNPGDYIRLGDADYIYCVIDGKNVKCEVNFGVMEYNFKI